MRILVVDDDPDQLSLRCDLLTHTGFQALAAADAGSAVSLSIAHKPECAIVDLHLPTERAGFQLVLQLKQLDPAMRVIVLTGYDSGGLKQACEAGLVDEVITKGSGSRALIEMLRKLADAFTATDHGLDAGAGATPDPARRARS